MRSFHASRSSLLVVAVVLSLFSGCATRDAANSAGGQMGAGEPSATATLAGTSMGEGVKSASGQMGTRELSATAVGAGEFSLEVDPLTNSGVVVLNRHKLVVEGDSVLLRGKEIMKLSPQSKKVEITYQHGRVTISDGLGPAKSLRL